MKKVLFIISLLALAGCDFPHSGGVGPPRPDRGKDGEMPPPEQTTPAPEQTTPAPPAAQ
ncbi:MAG: membrane lipoprotein lipid attachment site-containing protein [Gammaproteobacteria bacterium]